MKLFQRVVVVILIIGSVQLVQVSFPYEFSEVEKVLYDSEGEVLVAKKVEGYKQFSELPETVINLLVSHEDRRFWTHGGVDGKAIARAVANRIQTGTLSQGASTIDQQVIKIDQKAYVRTRPQKLKEIRLATVIQHQMSKEDILLHYANSMEFSNGVVGWRAACEHYWSQSCALVDKKKLLLLFVASREGLSLYNQSDHNRLINGAHRLSRLPDDQIMVFFSLIQTIDGNSVLANRLDPRVQDYLEDRGESGVYNQQVSSAIDYALYSVDAQRKKYGIQDCCVAVVDKEGHLVSMNFCSQRGDSYGSMVNSCMQPRQTGSAAKPFLYVLAMNLFGHDRTTTIVDEPVEYTLGEGGVYAPKNFDLRYHGEVTLGYALGNSLNIPAVKLVDQIGVREYLDFLKTLLDEYAPIENDNSKTAEDVGLSVALGTYEISPLGFTQLRRFFLSDSQYGREINEVTAILENPLDKVVSFGQDSFLNSEGRAVKTGTSRKFIDGRVCGASEHKQLTMCIRLGNVNNQPMQGSSSEVGSFVWHLVVQAVENNYQK